MLLRDESSGNLNRAWLNRVRAGSTLNQTFQGTKNKLFFVNTVTYNVGS